MASVDDLTYSIAQQAVELRDILGDPELLSKLKLYSSKAIIEAELRALDDNLNTFLNYVEEALSKDD
jgi:hypothetical protein